MRQFIFYSVLVFMINACSESTQKVQKQTTVEQKDYLETYYELEEVRYEEYLDGLAN